MMSSRFEGLELRSTITAGGELRVELVEVEVGDPGPDEVIVRVEATPINPSDILVLLGPVDSESLVAGGSDEHPTLRGRVAPAAMSRVRTRVDQPLVPGNEGAGLVVAAGSEARNLIGRRVGMRGGGMYTQFRKLSREDCIVLPSDAASVDGASLFINPLTALCFVETMRQEGHEALVHFAAASNLGRMLNRICIADRIALINVVRNADQAALLAHEGATHVLDSSLPDFEARLTEAIAETGATLCFDPIGGGRQASIALAAMEAAAAGKTNAYTRYGTDVFKQVYVYGLLDLAPTVLDRWVGFAWSVGGWLLSHRMRLIGPARAMALRQRVVDELHINFKTSYSRTLTLREALSPDVARVYMRKATGEKFLLTPNSP